VRLEALPLNPNGKLDRKALPAPDTSACVQPAHAPPRGRIEEALAGIWTRLLKLDRIERHDNFFELGGHSLAAVKLTREIQQVLGIRVPVSRVFAQPTLAGLAGTLADGAAAATATPLVRLQPHGDGPPVFCLPGALGSVLYLKPLATGLGLKSPVFGLPTPGLDRRPTPHTVPELAAGHLDVLRHRQPRSPYRLIGHSSGGRVAFEMARQLEQQGETVDLLAILDTGAPNHGHPAPRVDYTERQWLYGIVGICEDLTGASCGISPEALDALPDSDAAYAWVLRTLQQQEFLFTPDASLDELKALVALFRITIESDVGYCYPGPVRCPIHLFRASQSRPDAKSGADETWGWAACTGSRVEVIHVPGTHNTLLIEPNVQVLAERILQTLKGQ
jgi:thioesterase domain-containing protein/acyl carrier protein